jgi:hypothetical protein
MARLTASTLLWIFFTILLALVIPFVLLLLFFPPEMER